MDKCTLYQEVGAEDAHATREFSSSLLEACMSRIPFTTHPTPN